MDSIGGIEVVGRPVMKCSRRVEMVSRVRYRFEKGVWVKGESESRDVPE